MAFEFPKDTYAGKIVEVTIGAGAKAVKLGGRDRHADVQLRG